MISMSRVARPVVKVRVCPICKGTGQIKRARGGVDACPHCTRIAERIWLRSRKSMPPSAAE